MKLQAQTQAKQRTPKSTPQSSLGKPKANSSVPSSSPHTPLVTPSVAMTTPPLPKIPKFSGKDDGISIQAFLGIFDWAFDKITDDKEKMLKLVCFLEADAADFFGTEIVPVSRITWNEVKSRLISRYGHSDAPPVIAAIQRTLRSTETIRQYFDDKMRILRRINGLTEEERSDHLTHGLPDAYRTHFYGRRFGTTTDWLRCAQDIEADINRHSRRRNHSSHFTDSKSSEEDNPFPQKKPFKIGEGVCTFPCKFCLDIGLHEVHWHRDCPNRKKPSEEPSEAEAPTTGSNTYTSMSLPQVETI